MRTLLHRVVLALLVLSVSLTGQAQVLQSIKHGLPFPAYPTQFLAAPSLGAATFTLTAAGHKTALVFAATAAKAIRKVHFRTGTVTTGDTLDVRIETVDGAANGDPTGTLWATTTNGASVVAGTDDAVWKTVTLTSDATVAIGDVVALVIVNGGGGGNLQLITYADQTAGFPYGDQFTASWAKSTLAPMMVPEYSDGSFEPIVGFPDQGALINTTTFNSGSTTNRRGNIFQVPFPARANGCWLAVDADGDYTVKVYDSDGSTVLATTATINNFQRQSTAANIHFYPFTSTAALAASTNYRVVVVPGTVTSLSTYDFDVVSAPMLDMFPGGQAMHATVYTSSAWVETTTRRTYVGVILDAFSAGGGVTRVIGGDRQ